MENESTSTGVQVVHPHAPGSADVTAHLTGRAAFTTEDRIRRASKALVFIAWVVGIFIALSVIGGVTAAVVVTHHSQPSCVTVYGSC